MQLLCSNNFTQQVSVKCFIRVIYITTYCSALQMRWLPWWQGNSEAHKRKELFENRTIVGKDHLVSALMLSSPICHPSHILSGGNKKHCSHNPNCFLGLATPLSKDAASDEARVKAALGPDPAEQLRNSPTILSGLSVIAFIVEYSHNHY